MLTRTTLVATLALAAMLICVSCFPKETPLTESQKEYAGKWVDGESWIEIERDGGIHCSLEKLNVLGAGLTITEGKMVVDAGLFEQEWSIDQEPTEEDGVWTMKVDGRLFTRE